MQVTYTLEPADLTQFGKFYAMRRRQPMNVTRLIHIAVVMIILMALTAMNYSLVSSSRPGPPTAMTISTGLFISLVIPLACIVGIWTFLLRNVSKLPPASLFSRRQTLEISPENLHCQSEGLETIAQWSRVYDIASDERSLYFFTDEVTAYIVPRRAFQAPPLADAFLAAANAYKKGEPPPSDNLPGMWPPPPRTGV